MSEDNTAGRSTENIIFSHPTLRKESLVSGRYPTDSEKFPERQRPQKGANYGNYQEPDPAHCQRRR